MTEVARGNEETIEAWNGVLYDRFMQFRDVVVSSLGRHGQRALEVNPPAQGARVLDVGCGFGDSTQLIGDIIGPDGEVHGIDAAERFVETAAAEAEEAGATNVTFEVGDLQSMQPPQRYDYVFSRFGTMFFANPVAAMRNIRGALVPGGKLCMVVWRQKIENPWMYRAEQVVQQFVEEDENSDEPTCGPGPFSMAGADTTSGILVSAGFEDIALRRSDLEVRVADDLDRAVEFLMAIGPAGEVLRLAGDDAVRLRPRIEAALHEELAEYDSGDGVFTGTSTWLVTATNPG